MKDSKGFMWFGTESGLNKYDGYEFVIYKNNPFDSTSISNNQIQSTFEKSNVWNFPTPLHSELKSVWA